MLTSIWAWVALAALLLLQNFSFTVVSRARNSGSDMFHAVAAVFSNGVWVLVQVGLFAQWMEVWQTGDMRLLAGVGAFYVTFTVAGSIAGGKISRRYFERGKRQVGHYDEREKRLVSLEQHTDLSRDQNVALAQQVLRLAQSHVALQTRHEILRNEITGDRIGLVTLFEHVPESVRREAIARMEAAAAARN